MSKYKIVTCPECDGKGILWLKDYINADGNIDGQEIDCPICGGECNILVEDEEYYEDEDEEEDNVSE